MTGLAKGIAVLFFSTALWTSAAEVTVDNGTITLKEEADDDRRVDAGGYLRPLGVAFVLAGIIGGLVVLGRRFKPKRFFQRGRNIKVLETAYISPKHSLALVRVRNRIILLGLGQELSPIASFDRPEDVLSFDGGFSDEFASALDEVDETGPPRTRLENDAAAGGTLGSLKQALKRWRKSLREGAAT